MKVQKYNPRMCAKEKREKENKSVKISLPCQPPMSLDCCSLDVPWSKWWYIWVGGGEGSLQNTKSNGLKCTQARWERPGTFPQGGAFSLLVEGLRNECRCAPGAFGGLWHLRHGSCLSGFWARMPNQSFNGIGQEGEFYNPGVCVSMTRESFLSPRGFCLLSHSQLIIHSLS